MDPVTGSGIMFGTYDCKTVPLPISRRVQYSDSASEVVFK